VLHQPWLNVVTTTGTSPWINQPNDGVVTIASQTYLEKSMDIQKIKNNHYEVVISPEVVDIIRNRITLAVQ
jgi:hypothetical protein